jgi:hypothetical protein
MTPNGSLMAYTLPANMKELRDQVALVSISWKEQLERKGNETIEPEDRPDSPTDSERQIIQPDAIDTLTIEFDNRNIIVKYLQPKLLLVLEGGVPPGRRKELTVTVEAPGDARYPPDNQNDSRNGSLNPAMLGSSVGSKASTTASAVSFGRVSVLGIQRKKMEIMAQTIKDELQRSGFQMPDDPTNKFF